MKKVYFIIGTFLTIAALGCESPKVAEVIEKDCAVPEQLKLFPLYIGVITYLGSYWIDSCI